MEIKKLSNIDLLALIRTVSLELENRECEGKVTKYVAREIPSTVDAETVEHDGMVLRKVERDTKIGDFVRFFKSHYETIAGKFYEVVDDDDIYRDESGKATLSTTGWDGTKSREVFEVVAYETLKPVVIKSPNQQRAELIQRAREFVVKLMNSWKTDCCVYKGNTCTPVFNINAEKRTVVCLLKGVNSGDIYSRGIAKCMPGDVFNADIGKAIALAKALQIDIPQEFMQAVQPTEYYPGTIIRLRNSEPYVCQFSRKHPPSSERILDDTNAKYQFESVGD